MSTAGVGALSTCCGYTLIQTAGDGDVTWCSAHHVGDIGMVKPLVNGVLWREGRVVRARWW